MVLLINLLLAATLSLEAAAINHATQKHLGQKAAAETLVALMDGDNSIVIDYPQQAIEQTKYATDSGQNNTQKTNAELQKYRKDHQQEYIYNTFIRPVNGEQS